MKAEKQRAPRGSTWKRSGKKAGFSTSIGSYGYLKSGDRIFVLTAVKNGKTKTYESPVAAQRDGWYIVIHGK